MSTPLATEQQHALPLLAPSGSRGPSRLELEAMAAQLESTGDFRIIRKFMPRQAYGTPTAESVIRRGLVIDTETTGRDPRTARAIEICLLPFRFCERTGEIFDVGEPYIGTEDPHMPIPPDAIAVHGITDDDVRGTSFDVATVTRMVDEVEESDGYLIAHNARFDCPIMERHFPALVGRKWACSYRDIDWKQEGVASQKLEMLLQSQCGEFHHGHRADTDCHALLRILASQLPVAGRPALASLITTAKAPSHHIWAVDAAYHVKDTLKERGYQWNDGTNGSPKAWNRSVSNEQYPEEMEWLDQAVYRGRNGARVDTRTARDRHSLRPAEATVYHPVARPPVASLSAGRR